MADEPENVTILVSALRVFRESLQAYPQFQGEGMGVMLITVDNNNKVNLITNTQPEESLTLIGIAIDQIASGKPSFSHPVKPQ